MSDNTMIEISPRGYWEAFFWWRGVESYRLRDALRKATFSIAQSDVLGWNSKRIFAGGDLVFAAGHVTEYLPLRDGVTRLPEGLELQVIQPESFWRNLSYIFYSPSLWVLTFSIVWLVFIRTLLSISPDINILVLVMVTGLWPFLAYITIRVARHKALQNVTVGYLRRAVRLEAIVCLISLAAIVFAMMRSFTHP